MGWNNWRSKFLGLLLSMGTCVSGCSVIAGPSIQSESNISSQPDAILSYTNYSQRAGAETWYLIDPGSGKITQWMPHNQPAPVPLEASGHISNALPSGSAQTQQILFGKTLIDLDGSARRVPIRDRGFIEFSGGTSRQQTLSPDGKTIAYVDDRNGEQKAPMLLDIYLFDIQSRQTRRLTQFGTQSGEYGISTLAWSPDSQTIAFVRGGVLYRMAIQAGSPEPLLNFAYPNTYQKSASIKSLPEAAIYAPWKRMQWSPDGRYLSFVTRTDISPSDIVWLLDLQSRQVRPLFEAEPLRYRNGTGFGLNITDFVWSEDGQSIVLSAGRGDECRAASIVEPAAICRYYLYQVNLSEGKLVKLTHIPHEGGAELVWLGRSNRSAMKNKNTK